jgi:hypothetical protein
MDTAAKRYSAMNVMSPFRQTAAFPTGTIDGAMRQALAWLYSGIAATSEVIVLVFASRRRRGYKG